MNLSSLLGSAVSAFEETPFSPLRKAIPFEMDRLAARLAAYGVEQVRVGMEIEFCVEAASQKPQIARREKDRVLAELDARLSQSSGDEALHLTKQRAEVKEFNVREMMMYLLMEEDARQNNYLEPLFGRGHDGNGYYDGRDVCELKIAHTDAVKIPHRRKAVMQALDKKMSGLFLALQSIPTYHVNISFWKNGQNLFDPQHPEFATTGKMIAEGVVHGLYESAPVMLAFDEGYSPLPSFSCTADRSAYMRAASGRYEARICGIRPQDPDLVALILMAGALNGLTAQKRDEIAPASIVSTAYINHAQGQGKVLSHLLGGGALDENGYPKFSNQYFGWNVASIFRELGLESALIDGQPPRDNPLTPAVMRFLKGVRIEDSGIIWPETEPGFFRVTDIDMAQLRAMMEKKRLGVATHSGATLEDMVSPNARSFLIDIAALKTKITCKEFTKKLVVVPGYSMKTPVKGGFKEAVLERMEESAALRWLSPVFKDGLLDCAHESAIPHRPLNKYGDVVARPSL